MKNRIMDTPSHPTQSMQLTCTGLLIPYRPLSGNVYSPVGRDVRLDSRLLVAHPEHSGSHDKNDEKQDRPGINVTVGLGSFRVKFAHCIASLWFLWVIAFKADRRRLTPAIARVKSSIVLITNVGISE